jgi:hypothetical protein
MRRRTRLKTFCVIENAGFKGNLRTYLWTYLKVLDPAVIRTPLLCIGTFHLQVSTHVSDSRALHDTQPKNEITKIA